MIIYTKKKIKRVVMSLVVLMGLLIVVACGWYQYKAQLGHIDEELDNSSFRIADNLLQSIDALQQDVYFLSRTPPVSGIERAIFNHGFDAQEKSTQSVWVDRLQQIFAAFAEAHPSYVKIRYIGVADRGRELVRVEYQDKQIIVVQDDQLQSQGDRDYFLETLKLRKGEIYLSDISDNWEQGSLEVSHIRTLRAATPVFTAAGEPFGIVVINMDIGDILDRISLNLPDDVKAFATDNLGHYLVHPEPGKAFGFELGKNDSFKQDFPDLPPDGISSKAQHQRLQETNSRNGEVFISTQRLHFDPRLPERFLLLSYVIPKSAVLAKLLPLGGFLMLGFILTVVSIGFLCQLWFRHIFLPLENITQAAQIIAAGGRDIDLPDAEIGEIDTLTQAFRHMLAKVVKRESDYTVRNKMLVNRVIKRTAELKLAANVVKNTSEGVLVVDHKSHIIAVNPAFVEITGYTAEEAIGQKPSLLRSSHHDKGFYQIMWQTLLSTGVWQGEVWNRRKSGEVYLEWLTINVIPGEKDQPNRYVGIFNDVTDLRRKDERIRYLAFHDPLTGLPNRSLLKDRLEHAVSISERDAVRLAVMFIDLNRFKIINDTFGHEMGDQLLQEVALRFSAVLRHSDTVARLGGDEFVILLEHQSMPEYCVTLANALINALEKPIEIKGVSMQVGASIGIALFPKDGGSAVELMKHADTAMYAAKMEEGSAYRFFQPAMDEPSQAGKRFKVRD